MTKAAWFTTAGALMISGFAIAAWSHENVPKQSVDFRDVGQVAIQYEQRAPSFGKVASLLCAVGTAGSLFLALREEEVEVAVTSQPKRKRGVTAATVSVAAPVQYDEDDEVVIDDEPEVEAKVAPVLVANKSVEVKSGFFPQMFYHRKRHAFVPCATGSGKTTMVLGAMEFAFEEFGLDGIEFFISTAKQGNFLGLEDKKAADGKRHVLFIDPSNPDTILPLYERLQWLKSRLTKRGLTRKKAEDEGKTTNPKRNVIILDEWNTCLIVAQQFDRQFNASLERGEQKSSVYDDLKDLVNLFALMGREDEMAIWIFGQDHQVQNAGINTGYRKNFGYVIPFRGDGGMESIDDAFLGRSPLVANRLASKFHEEAYERIEEDPDATWAYSSLQGHEFVKIPYLPDIKRKKLFTGDSATSKVVNMRPQPTPAAVGAEELEDVWG